MPPRFIARQLSRPTGLIGRVIGRLMNRHNAKMNAFAVEQLALTPTDRVLEIGFGGGVALPSLIRAAAFIGGVDRSRDCVQWANVRYSAVVKAGRAAFREGSVEAIPFETASFEKVCTVNTVYFWPSLDAGFIEIHRVLVGYPTDIFTTRTPDEVIAALTRSGFQAVHIERPAPTTKWSVIVATR